MKSKATVNRWEHPLCPNMKWDPCKIVNWNKQDVESEYTYIYLLPKSYSQEVSIASGEEGGLEDKGEREVSLCLKNFKLCKILNFVIFTVFLIK